MKRIIYVPLLLLLVTILIGSCTSRKKDANAITAPAADTLGLAEFQRWKMENEIRAQVKAEQELIDEKEAKSTYVAAPVVSAKKNSSGTRSTSSRSGKTYRSGGYNQGSAGTVAQPSQAPRKKGMSHTAKGAIVGAASGAVIGAVANKKDRVGGGVVGGVVGAATGAGIGILVDKKERKREQNLY